MIYLTRMLGKPVVDAAGETIGTISDVAIATGEIFPRVTSLAFTGPDKTPFMLSWRKFVEKLDDEQITLNAARPELRFSYLQPDEVLLARDLLNKQIVDTQGMKVVRVNDLKLSESRNQLRLLGAEVGARGILRGLWPPLETAAVAFTGLFGRPLAEDIIAWNYMDLLDRDLSHVQLSVTHKRLHELHPADVADILEQLSPSQRAKVFEHLDNEAAAETISELEDELQAAVIDDLTSQRASDILEIMDPDDAADIVGDLEYDKAEALLRLMGVKEARQVRKLLGYKEKTAGGIMTPEVTTVTAEMSIQEVIDHLRTGAAENENIYYVYVVSPRRILEGVVSLRDLIVSPPDTKVADILVKDVITVNPDDDQEDVAETMSKYDLLAMPVVDEAGRLLGMVTVDDALDVMEQESAEDLELATGRREGVTGLLRWVSRDGWLVVWAALFLGAAALSRVSAGIGMTLLGAVVLSPVVLRLAEDVASHTMSRVIDPEDEEVRAPFWKRLAMDGLAGLAIGVVIALLVIGIGVLVAPQEPSASALGGFLAVGVAAGLAVVFATLAGTVIGHFAEARAAADKRVSQVLVAVSLMFVGEAAFLVLLLLALSLVPAPRIVG
jgi:magnesium transporter